MTTVNIIVIMYTTLRQIRKHCRCDRGWQALTDYLGKTEVDDMPISMDVILDAVGIQAAIWALCTVDGHQDIKGQFKTFCDDPHTPEEIYLKYLQLFGESDAHS